MSRSHRRETAEYRIERRGRARRQPYRRRETERDAQELLLELELTEAVNRAESPRKEAR